MGVTCCSKNMILHIAQIIHTGFVNRTEAKIKWNYLSWFLRRCTELWTESAQNLFCQSLSSDYISSSLLQNWSCIRNQSETYLLKMNHDIFWQFHILEHAFQFAGESSTAFCHKIKAKIPERASIHIIFSRDTLEMCHSVRKLRWTALHCAQLYKWRNECQCAENGDCALLN